MATPLQVAQSVVDTVPSLTALQRLRLRNNWATAWDDYAAQHPGPPRAALGWWVQHQVVGALDRADPERSWPVLAERARARWESTAEGDPRAEIWQISNRFVVRDTIRGALARDTDLDRDIYALLTAAWRAVFPGFDA